MVLAVPALVRGTGAHRLVKWCNRIDELQGYFMQPKDAAEITRVALRKASSTPVKHALGISKYGHED